jgi:hypothetical protein
MDVNTNDSTGAALSLTILQSNKNTAAIEIKTRFQKNKKINKHLAPQERRMMGRNTKRNTLIGLFLLVLERLDKAFSFVPPPHHQRGTISLSLPWQRSSTTTAVDELMRTTSTSTSTSTTTTSPTPPILVVGEPPYPPLAISLESKKHDTKKENFLIHRGRSGVMIKRSPSIAGIGLCKDWTPEATRAFQTAVEKLGKREDEFEKRGNTCSRLVVAHASLLPFFIFTLLL